jgi:hypothetical protein
MRSPQVGHVVNGSSFMDSILKACPDGSFSGWLTFESPLRRLDRRERDFQRHAVGDVQRELVNLRHRAEELDRLALLFDAGRVNRPRVDAFQDPREPFENRGVELRALGVHSASPSPFLFRFRLRASRAPVADRIRRFLAVRSGNARARRG